jgi:hypothetical protein
VNGDFTQFPATGVVDGASTTDMEMDLKLVNFEGDIPLELKARLPKHTTVVTSSLGSKKQLHEIDGLQLPNRVDQPKSNGR